jgi:hypothetical protein
MMGDNGAAALSATNRIAELASASQEQHLAMLNALFLCLFGSVTTVFTSGQLRERGFDDAREPKIENYYDFL